MASMVGNPSGGGGEPASIRAQAVAKAASNRPTPSRGGGVAGVSGHIGRGGNGPTPNERAAKREARQDRLERAKQLAPAYQAGQGRYSQTQNPRNPTIQT